MKPKNSYRLLILTLMGVVIYSCQNDDFQVEEQSQQVNNSLEDPFADVPRLENPYSVENMKKALQSLKNKNARNYKYAKVYATHY